LKKTTEKEEPKRGKIILFGISSLHIYEIILPQATIGLNHSYTWPEIERRWESFMILNFFTVKFLLSI